MTRYRWVILAAGTAAQASFSAASVGLPALAPALRSHYALTLGQTGVVLGAMSLGMVPTLFAWGLAADRIGERAVIALGLASGGVALAAAGWTRSYPALVALLALSGALGCAVNAASGRAVMSWFVEEERGTALGIRQAAIPVGGAAAAVALPLLASAGGTKLAFVVLGAGFVAGGALGGALMREPAGRRGAAPARDERPPVRDRGMWTLAGGSSLYLTAQIAFTGFVVLFLHIHRGVSTHAAAAVLATMNLLGIAARILAGRWSDHLRARVRPLRTVGLALAVATVVAAALVDAPLWVLVPAFLVAGVLGLSWNGLSFTAAAERAGAARAGAALGLQQTSLAVVGALVFPAFAALVAGTSWRLAFAVAAAGPLLGAFALRRVPEARAPVQQYMSASGPRSHGALPRPQSRS